MKSFGLKMSLVFFILVIVGGFGIVSASLKFEPEGVRREHREAYEKKLAQLRSEEKKSSNGDLLPKAKVEVVEKHYNFGMLDPHTTASHSFEIRNMGDADLFLKAGETSCKCTVGTVGAETIPPGHLTHVTLEWNTGYQAEDYHQSAIVHTNDPSQPTITLSVQGQIRAELVLMHTELTLPSVDLGKSSSATTYLYSQLWDDFVVDSVKCDLPGFQWIAEPIDVKELPSSDLEAKSAWRLKLTSLPAGYGKFSGKAVIGVTPAGGGKGLEREVSMAGRVRAAIAFDGPELDVKKGLELGLLVRGEEHRKSVIVRVRDEQRRNIVVLDVMPKSLKAEIEETRQAGAYRLTIIVPADATPSMFNSTQEHGYVQVGDPDDRKFMNWMPIMGGVINPPSN